MSHILHVSKQNSIDVLAAKGWSERRIAKELGIHRNTVKRYLAAPRVASDPVPVPVAGSTLATSDPPTLPPDPPDPGDGSVPLSDQNQQQSGRARLAAPAFGKRASRNLWEPFRDAIQKGLDRDLGPKRIYQDLRAAQPSSAPAVPSYAGLKRFISGLAKSLPRPVKRIETQPGEELQIDFLQGPLIPSSDGSKRRRCHIFRAVLSYSRKGYSEATLRQDSESFLRVLENAMRHLGGVPLVLNLDNLKAAVLNASWYDPELSPKFAAFCKHYGTSAMPCKPYTPEHKGKVERSVHYLKQSALKGHEFSSLVALNLHLRQWEQQVADQRIHGTLYEQVASRYHEERKALQPLPDALFASFSEELRKVDRDGYVRVQRAHYEVPAEHIGTQVWVRWDSHCVRFYTKAQQTHIISHTRLEPGRYSSGTLGLQGMPSGPVGKTLRMLLAQSVRFGPCVESWVKRSIQARGAASMQSIYGLLGLHPKHSAEDIHTACEAAHSEADLPSLTQIKAKLRQPAAAVQLPLPGFATHGSLIRPLSSYSQVIDTLTRTHNSTPSHDA